MERGNSLTDHEKGMIDTFEKDGHSQREIAPPPKKKSADQGVQWIITLKKRAKHPKRFQAGQKNSVQRINGPLSKMLENPENQFLKFNFLVTIMFHVGQYGEL